MDSKCWIDSAISSYMVVDLHIVLSCPNRKPSYHILLCALTFFLIGGCHICFRLYLRINLRVYFYEELVCIHHCVHSVIHYGYA